MKTRLTIIGIIRLLSFGIIATGFCFLFPAYVLPISLLAGGLYVCTMAGTIATEAHYQKHRNEISVEAAEELRNSSIFSFYETPICHYIEGKIAFRKFKKQHPEVKNVEEALKMMDSQELSNAEKDALTDNVKNQETTTMVASNDNEEKEELTK